MAKNPNNKIAEEKKRREEEEKNGGKAPRKGGSKNQNDLANRSGGSSDGMNYAGGSPNFNERGGPGRGGGGQHRAAVMPDSYGRQKGGQGMHTDDQVISVPRQYTPENKDPGSYSRQQQKLYDVPQGGNQRPAENQANPNDTRMAGDAMHSITSSPKTNNAYDNRVTELMNNRGMSKEEAQGNQAAAIKKGADLNNDGAVTDDEWEKHNGMTQYGTGNSALDARVDELVANRGWTRHEAVKNQYGAAQQGADLNGDGAVTNDEWAKFQSNGDRMAGDAVANNPDAADAIINSGNTTTDNSTNNSNNTSDSNNTTVGDSNVTGGTVYADTNLNDNSTNTTTVGDTNVDTDIQGGDVNNSSTINDNSEANTNVGDTNVNVDGDVNTDASSYSNYYDAGDTTNVGGSTIDASGDVNTNVGGSTIDASGDVTTDASSQNTNTTTVNTNNSSTDNSVDNSMVDSNNTYDNRKYDNSMENSNNTTNNNENYGIKGSDIGNNTGAAVGDGAQGMGGNNTMKQDNSRNLETNTGNISGTIYGNVGGDYSVNFNAAEMMKQYGADGGGFNKGKSMFDNFANSQMTIGQNRNRAAAKAGQWAGILNQGMAASGLTKQ